MDQYTIRHLTFAYPEQPPVLEDICCAIPQGAFVTLCGPTGCGKSTLLRQLKTVLTPHGHRRGEVLYEGKPLEQLTQGQQAAAIGFVLQSPEDQLVTDRVWHELAFGLESLGVPQQDIRRRVSEMASFFGIEDWFHRPVAELSGGQKQLLNLAAVMVLQPSVLILDEPTAQLDPIAAVDFLGVLQRVNRELGVTILLTEHRLEEVLPLSHRLLVLDRGRLICDATPGEAARQLGRWNHPMALAMPTPVRVYAGVTGNHDDPGASVDNTATPVTVGEGRRWLSGYAQHHPLVPVSEEKPPPPPGPPAVVLRDVWFRHHQDGPQLLGGLTLEAHPGRMLAVLGGNGAGKTTLLEVIGGLHRPQRGRVEVLGQSPESQLGSTLGMLPQAPQSLFVKEVVEEDLLEMLSHLPRTQAMARLEEVSHLCLLTHLHHRHPYELSGGEQQRLALAKVLLMAPKVLLLDEPTKGLDSRFKEELAGILTSLMARGTAVIMVTHDLEFCARYAHRCGLLFDGALVGLDSPRGFFGGNSFYTTAASRMARPLLPSAVTAEDIIRACGGRETPPPPPGETPPQVGPPSTGGPAARPVSSPETHPAQGFSTNLDSPGPSHPAAAPGEAPPNGSLHAPGPAAPLQSPRQPLPPATLAGVVVALAAIPLTIWLGMTLLGSRRYQIVSLLVLLEAMVPMALVFEGRKPQARELILLAVLSALVVAGRLALFMVPQFKPMAALIILTGVALGAERGFLVGALSAFVSNYFFRQGPWTPWQMLAFGLLGLTAGLLFHRGPLPARRWVLCLFGGLAVPLLYGGITNPASVLLFQQNPTWGMVAATYLAGLPFDLLHAASTVLFLWLMTDPVLQKLERIRRRYGLGQ